MKLILTENRHEKLSSLSSFAIWRRNGISPAQPLALSMGETLGSDKEEAAFLEQHSACQSNNPHELAGKSWPLSSKSRFSITSPNNGAGSGRAQFLDSLPLKGNVDCVYNLLPDWLMFVAATLRNGREKTQVLRGAFDEVKEIPVRAGEPVLWLINAYYQAAEEQEESGEIAAPENLAAKSASKVVNLLGLHLVAPYDHENVRADICQLRQKRKGGGVCSGECDFRLAPFW